MIQAILLGALIGSTAGIIIGRYIRKDSFFY